MAPIPGSNTWPPCVCPDSTSGTSSCRGLREPSRIVSQEQRGRSGPLQHLHDVRHAPRPEADADDVDGFVADGDGRALILQHREAPPRQCRRHVSIVVVVAEDGERTVRRRRQRRQQLGDRLDERAIAVGDVVAAEHRQIGPRIGEKTDRARHMVGRHRVAVMNVGDEPDAQPVERGRQAGDRHVLIDADDPMTLVGGAVRERSGGGADGRCDHRAQRVTPGEAHGDSIRGKCGVRRPRCEVGAKSEVRSRVRGAKSVRDPWKSVARVRVRRPTCDVRPRCEGGEARTAESDGPSERLAVRKAAVRAS